MPSEIIDQTVHIIFRPLFFAKLVNEPEISENLKKIKKKKLRV